ncbi:MAG: hypothetical protein ACR2FG_09365 [Marmoricola sp.]
MSGWGLGRKGAVALLVLTAVTFVPVGSASGSCVGPELRVGAGGAGPATLSAGSTVEVRGSWFHNGCSDAGGGSAFGCATSGGDGETPMKHVTLSLRQGHRQWKLGTRGAATDDGQITWQVTIPVDVHPGHATLVANDTKQKITVEQP